MMNKRLRIIVLLLVWGIMSICLYVSIYTQMPLYSKILCASFATIMYLGIGLDTLRYRQEEREIYFELY